MKLITVEAEVAAADLDKALELFEAEAGAVRAMAGCQSYAVYRAASGGRFAIVQKWADMAAFDAYRASPNFAAMGGALKPMMVAPPVTTIAEADL